MVANKAFPRPAVSAKPLASYGRLKLPILSLDLFPTLDAPNAFAGLRDAAHDVEDL